MLVIANSLDSFSRFLFILDLMFEMSHLLRTFTIHHRLAISMLVFFSEGKNIFYLIQGGVTI